MTWRDMNFNLKDQLFFYYLKLVDVEFTDKMHFNISFIS